MGNFNQGDRDGFRSGGRNGERGGGFQKKIFGGADRGNKEPMMHQATCSECGKRCEVPFRPVNGKPVYCTDCFSAKRGANPNAGGDRVPAKFHYENRDNRGGWHDDGVKRLLSEMNMKLDRLIKTMESSAGADAKSFLSEMPKKEMKKKSVNVADLKKVLDKATGKEPTKTKTVKKVAAEKKKK